MQDLWFSLQVLKTKKKQYIYNIHIFKKYIDKMWRTNHIIIFCTILWSVYGQQQQNSENENNNEEDEIKSHRRSKRFLWMTHEKRLVLPVRNFDK